MITRSNVGGQSVVLVEVELGKKKNPAKHTKALNYGVSNITTINSCVIFLRYRESL